jgi:hypothetical protein
MKYLNKNETFFDILTNENSYWAGFIAADGYLSESKRTLNVNLSLKDKNHLEILKQQLNPDFKIKDYRHICSLNNKEQISCRFAIVSDKIIADLKKNWGLHQAKTFTLEFPSHLNLESKKSFLSGYIDGDGSINIIENKNNKIQLSICGNYKFLLGVRSFLKEEIGIELNNNIYKSRGIYTFATNGTPAVKILDFLYDEKLPIMKRKWKIYLANKDRNFGQYIRWTEEDISMLISNYSTMSVSEIHNKFFNDRSYESVEKKISHIKLHKPGREPQINWTQEENTIFQEAINNGLTTKQIHDSIFKYRTYYSVRNQRRKLYNREKNNENHTNKLPAEREEESSASSRGQ